MNKRRAPSLQALNALDHAVTQVARGLEQIVELCPEVVDFDADEAPEAQVECMLQSPRVIMAKNIGQAYMDKKLPLIDQIIASRQGQVEVLTLPDVDAGVMPAETEKKPEKKEADGPKEKQWPPPLPVIKKERIRDQVFTHKSVANKRYYLSEAELLHDHNERLEFLGDAVLNYTISQVVFRRFRDLPEGDLTAIRSHLVKNETLWEWATIYGLDKKLKTEFDVLPDADGKKSKLISDVMEAYIGGVCLDSAEGNVRIRQWLLDLVEPYVQRIAKEREKIKPLNKDAKNDLYVKIGSMDMRPEYVTVVEGDNLHPFTVECRIMGETIGVGKGPNTKEAGLRAAMAALDNRSTIEKYAEIRRQTPRQPDTNSNSPPLKKAKKAQPEATPENLKNLRQTVQNGQANSKDVLYSLIGSAVNRPNYLTEYNNGDHYTKVYMRNDLLGEGRGATKKIAEQTAAYDALNKEDLMKKWADLRS
jgi:ribonuclease-3